MLVHFYLRFHTQIGQQLSLTVQFENTATEQILPLSYLNDAFWQAVLEVDVAHSQILRYQYTFITEKGEAIVEGEKHRKLEIEKHQTTPIAVIDTWNDQRFYENAFYTAPFANVLLPAVKQHKVKKSRTTTHLFKVKAPVLAHHEVVCLTGAAAALGNWDIEKVHLLTREGTWWVYGASLKAEDLPLDYKYGIYNSKKNAFVRFEEGPNRNLATYTQTDGLNMVHDAFVHLPNTVWKGSGVAIPVFSLRSEKSLGIGEFTDLKLLADWAVKTGLKLIQILPVNDTIATGTWRDSYPYAAISAFALHPIYINLNAVGGKRNHKALQLVYKNGSHLNTLPDVDYEAVLKLKLDALETLYQEQRTSIVKEKEYKSFFEENSHWLVPYAAFCFLRDKWNTTDYSQWKSHQSYNHFEIQKLLSPKTKSAERMGFYFFVQYHLHLQLGEAAAYAHKQGIVLKGDIPIGVFRNGADTWTAPDLYNINQQAGAPPDDFAVKGQNWGFPTYNWQRMQENDFAWWRQRFQQMSHYFDAFRIDHILGFFRIWSIPEHAVEGILGRFVPAKPISITEFQDRHIPFDADRFCKPFITDEILETIFSLDAPLVKETFLKPHAGHSGRYILLDDFDTQKKVQSFLAAPGHEDLKKFEAGLFDLISNVVLFEEEGSATPAFHFRISIEHTTAFQQLDNYTKSQLYPLYIDYFYRRQDDFWKEEALRKLPALKASTNMLICGEDLGMVPHCVPDVMSRLGILSLEIQRMPKNPQTEFFHPKDAPYLSVITPSTHDMSTVRAWWKEERARTQQFYNLVLGQWGEAPGECEGWISRAIVLQHLYAPAMWAIFQLQDLLGTSEKLRRPDAEAERINVPAIPQYYWRYRMHVTLEQLLVEEAFNTELRDYIHNSGR